MITMQENLEVDRKEADRLGNTLDETGTERGETERERERERGREREKRERARGG